MGYKDILLPSPLVKSHYAEGLAIEKNTQQPYNDDSCFFKALALHFQGKESRE